MKKVFCALWMAALFGCSSKETKLEQQQNLVLQAMTNGQWKVSLFTKGSTDITAGFGSYTFQFKTNQTVDAINNGTVENTGSWNADANAQTITSLFNNAGDPLVLLNGTWTITSTTWTSVKANQTVGGEARTLHLQKL